MVAVSFLLTFTILPLKTPTAVSESMSLLQERCDYPNGVFQVTFWLKPEVPFAKLVCLDAALQGLNDFQGYRLKGYTFYPDVRLVSS